MLNKKKQKVLPDEFFTFGKKKEVSDKGLVNAERFQKATQVYTCATDFELIRFIDEKCSSLISNFIQ